MRHARSIPPAASCRGRRRKPMTSKDLQAHYRAELTKMLDPARREKHVTRNRHAG